MNINELKNKAFDELEKVKNPADLERFKIKYLGRKSGELTAILRSLKDLSVEKRKVIGQKANQFKKDLEKMFKDRKKKISAQGGPRFAGQNTRIDITAPGKKIFHGHLHPITLTLRKIEDIFHSMGFKIIEGPDIETEYYNFEPH
jgi:phenylalanyl-tRNA synthetase alpha chain